MLVLVHGEIMMIRMILMIIDQIIVIVIMDVIKQILVVIQDDMLMMIVIMMIEEEDLDVTIVIPDQAGIGGYEIAMTDMIVDEMIEIGTAEDRVMMMKKMKTKMMRLKDGNMNE